jgi:myo-inositol-1-phosphate synthase
MAPPHDTTPATFNAAPKVAAPLFKVHAPNVQYTDDHILAEYTYNNTLVTKADDGSLHVEPKNAVYHFKTDTKVPKLGYVKLKFSLCVGWPSPNP